MQAVVLQQVVQILSRRVSGGDGGKQIRTKRRPMRLGQAGIHGLEFRLKFGAEISRRGQATSLAALAVLATGFVVLIGAAAAGERARIFEAAVLKTLGATRGQVLASFALRSALMGAAAGLVAGLAAGAILTQVMELDYRFAAGSALAVVAGGVGATLAAGLVFALRPLSVRPACELRAWE